MRMPNPLANLPHDVMQQLLGLSAAATTPPPVGPLLAALAAGRAASPLFAGDVEASPAIAPARAPATAQASFDIKSVSDKQLMHFARQFNPKGPNPDERRNAIVWDEIKRRQQIARSAAR